MTDQDQEIDGEPHTIYDERRDKYAPKTFPSKAVAKGELQSLFNDELIESGKVRVVPEQERPETESDSKASESDDKAEQDNKSNGADGSSNSAEPVPTDDVQPKSDSDVVEAEVINSPEQLSKDPIKWLESYNNEFVHTIKGTPAISKKGFRFIQAQFGITTESEVVEWIDGDHTGVIVWAKAELPDGQSAEAHGEGWLFESDVDNNEFVRYADTRAKNRAISDLTSSGALAASEVSGER